MSELDKVTSVCLFSLMYGAQRVPRDVIKKLWGLAICNSQ